MTNGRSCTQTCLGCSLLVFYSVTLTRMASILFVSAIARLVRQSECINYRSCAATSCVTNCSKLTAVHSIVLLHPCMPFGKQVPNTFASAGLSRRERKVPFPFFSYLDGAPNAILQRCHKSPFVFHLRRDMLLYDCADVLRCHKGSRKPASPRVGAHPSLSSAFHIVRGYFSFFVLSKRLHLASCCRHPYRLLAPGGVRAVTAMLFKLPTASGAASDSTVGIPASSSLCMLEGFMWSSTTCETRRYLYGLGYCLSVSVCHSLCCVPDVFRFPVLFFQMVGRNVGFPRTACARCSATILCMLFLQRCRFLVHRVLHSLRSASQRHFLTRAPMARPQ
jgi:hypothetical protein